MEERTEGFKMGLSTVESKGETSSLRTSHNAFVSDTGLSLEIQERIFGFLGLEKFEISWADGIQVCVCVFCFCIFAFPAFHVNNNQRTLLLLFLPCLFLSKRVALQPISGIYSPP